MWRRRSREKRFERVCDAYLRDQVTQAELRREALLCRPLDYPLGRGK